MMMRKVAACVLLALFLLVLSFSPLEAAFDDDASGFCGAKCKVRCAKAGVKDRCLSYCGICCKICKCVPSGTYGNKHECPCYRDRVNKKGKAKCP